jgi:hypothetical protein
MASHPKIVLYQIIGPTLISIGVITVVLSALYTSSYLAILSSSLIFWGCILLYLTPSKHVSTAILTVLTATATNNIERIITETETAQKGIFLPPNRLQTPGSSIVFLPKTHQQHFSQTPETKQTGLFNSKKDGVFLTPPGFGLLQIFEKELGYAFTRIDLPNLEPALTKVLVENLGLAENIKITVQGNVVVFEVAGSILKDECRETQKFPKVHNAVGCTLSSSLACVLAKASGKAVIIENEKFEKDGRAVKIEYLLLED